MGIKSDPQGGDGDKQSGRPLVIVGAGEFAEIAYQYFTFDSDYRVIGFAVEESFRTSETLHGLPVTALERLETIFPPGTVEIHVAITYTKMNSVRVRIYSELKARGYAFANYISSRAFVWRNAILGENVFIFENNVVQPFCEIGNAVVLWSGNHIGHRSVIHDGVYVSSHVVISGFCRIGERCFIGVNAAFADHVSIAADCFVAMASSVTRSSSESDRVIKGAPAVVSNLSAKRLMKVG